MYAIRSYYARNLVRRLLVQNVDLLGGVEQDQVDRAGRERLDQDASLGKGHALDPTSEEDQFGSIV